DKDPLKFADASRYESITYLEVLSQGLAVMDATSIAMCRDNKLPILVFNLNTNGNIMRMSMGEPVGTVIHYELGTHPMKTEPQPAPPATSFNSVKEIEANVKTRMEKAITDLQHELASIRTGR